jgi:hypothetical protein
MTRLPHLVFASGVAAIACPATAYAQDMTMPLQDDDAGLEAVSDDELAEQRGGFTVSGVEVRLGAEMRTYMNGELVLQTVVNWDQTAATTTQIVSGALSQSSMDALRAGYASGGAVQVKLGSTPVYMANGGQTAIIQRTDGGIQNVILNTASNVNLMQQTNATLDFAGYGAFKNNIMSMRTVSAIDAMIGAGALQALGR